MTGSVTEIINNLPEWLSPEMAWERAVCDAQSLHPDYPERAVEEILAEAIDQLTQERYGPSYGMAHAREIALAKRFPGPPAPKHGSCRCVIVRTGT